jgi:hypothetical protein
MLRTTSAAAAIIAFATVGSALFGGAALANGENGDGKEGKKHVVVNNTGGPGGPGGDVWQECDDQEATAFNIFKGKVYDESTQTQTATASNACTATGGAGGAGGTGATY